jgi:Leucine-rich repeat (LRR) protein
VNISVTDENDKTVITRGPVADPSECVTGGAVADGANAGLVSDCEALLASEEALVGTGTGLNWDASTPIGDWDGVSVGDGRVANIYLRGHGLAGMIPDGINDLAGLVKLQLHDNDLGGPIPDLSDLDDLEWLILHRNAFTGGIPASLGGMESLDYLYLYSNDGGFDGGIPAELGDATTLRRLYLHDNGLTGEIPGELGDLPILRSLLLSRNELSGSIPSELGDLTDLKALYLYDNMLTGSIPSELGNLMSSADDTLRILYLHKNMLTGQIPSELGNLTALTNLWLNGNMLSGNIPNELGNLTNLARWRLSGNMLTGCIPMALADVSNSDMAATGLSACSN